MYDAEGDYLEVMLSDAAGFMIPTEDDAIMQMVDDEGKSLGFSVMAVSKLIREQHVAARLIAMAT